VLGISPFKLTGEPTDECRKAEKWTRSGKSCGYIYFHHGLRGSRQIGRVAECSKTAVNDCLNRAQERGVASWAQIDGLDDVKLEELLGLAAVKTMAVRPLPCWPDIDQELRRRDHQMTLKLLWEEYRAAYPDGYSYTQFWKRFSAWKKKQSLVNTRRAKRPLWTFATGWI
jgi:hypothetical protein